MIWMRKFFGGKKGINYDHDGIFGYNNGDLDNDLVRLSNMLVRQAGRSKFAYEANPHPAIRPERNRKHMVVMMIMVSGSEE